jgi:ubiquinone/menaquinone biosynthesis C-methylase UbiE
LRPALGFERLRRIYDRASGRYDLQHGLLTLWSDQRGRRLVVEEAVRPNDRILDVGAGTGSTALLALAAGGPGSTAVLLDSSEEMLAQARAKLAAGGRADRAELRVGDMMHLPFPDGAFDVVLSTYSLCPVGDPTRGTREMWRVTRPGGRIGVAHSTEPARPITRVLGRAVDSLAWRIPALSLGCRAVSALPALVQMGGRIVFERRIGVPLWPFEVFVVGKPAAVPNHESGRSGTASS